MGAGELEPGGTLPPLRELAADLGVNPNTVAAAYRLLRDRGVIETAGRRGSRVRARPSVAPRDQIGVELPAGARDLSTGNPDPALLPPLAPATAAAAAAMDREPVLYGCPATDPALLRLAAAAFRADGLPNGPVAVASGSLDAIERIFTAQLRQGDCVGVEDPGWGSLLDLVPALGLRAEPVAVDDEGPLPAEVARALSAGARALVVTSRAQNPTGAALTADRARDLRTVLAAHPAVLLVEDDHGHGIVDLPYHPLAAVPGAGPLVEHWAVVRSAAKAYGPDLRLSVTVGDVSTIDRVLGRQRLGTGWVSHVLQRTVAELWRTDAAPAPKVAAVYRERRNALLAALAENGVAARGVSGLNVWIPVQDEAAALTGLLQRGWAAAPGARFRQESPPGIRLTISTLTAHEVPLLAADITAALRPHRGRTTARFV